MLFIVSAFPEVHILEHSVDITTGASFLIEVFVRAGEYADVRQFRDASFYKRELNLKTLKVRGL